ncbi:MAG: transcriptional regulator, partial [Myxococcales bacterium]|nr:transcriptional regulator [Myxococcales bacterium]
RRVGICEERGSGIDKVVAQIERQQLPAPLFEVIPGSTRAVLFGPRPLKDMDKAEQVQACYLHACLKYVERDYMTNTTLRERLGIEERNRSTASRLIKETQEAGLIALHDPEAAPRYYKYVPHWAKRGGNDASR